MRTSTKLIFVVGASRSGTTMLSRILDNNSQISAFKELHYFGDLFDPTKVAKKLTGKEITRLISSLLARQEKEIWNCKPRNKEIGLAMKMSYEISSQNNISGFDVFERVASKFAHEKQAVFAVEHTPRNIFYTEQILQNYPNAFVIFVARDPRAVLASQKKRWRRKWLGGGNIPWKEIFRAWVNYHPITMSKLWNKATITALKFTNRQRFMLVRFEDIAEYPKQQIERICEFISIKFEESMLDIPHVGSSNEDHKTVSGGVNKDVVNKWRIVLSDGEIAICEKVCKLAMRELKYSPLKKKQKSFLSIAYQLLKFPCHITSVVFTNPKRAYIQFRAIVKVSK